MKKLLLTILATFALPLVTNAVVINTGWQYDTTAVVQYPYNFPYSNPKIGIGTSSPYAMLSVVGETVASYFTATTTTATSTFNGGISGAGLFSLLQNGLLGLGTSTPSQKLSVQGSALISGNISLANLTATGTITVGGTQGISTSTFATGISVGTGYAPYPELTFNADPNTGIDSTAPDVMNLVNAGVNTVTLTSSNTVGIGSTSPSQKLAVQGNTLISGNITSVANITATGTLTVAMSTSTLQGTVLASSGGSVGIGTTSPGYAAKLGVAGEIFVGGTGTSTFAGGIEVPSGKQVCIAGSTTCLGGGGSSYTNGTFSTSTSVAMATTTFSIPSACGSNCVFEVNFFASTTYNMANGIGFCFNNCATTDQYQTQGLKYVYNTTAGSIVTRWGDFIANCGGGGQTSTCPLPLAVITQGVRGGGVTYNETVAIHCLVYNLSGLQKSAKCEASYMDLNIESRADANTTVVWTASTGTAITSMSFAAWTNSNHATLGTSTQISVTVKQ